MNRQLDMFTKAQPVTARVFELTDLVIAAVRRGHIFEPEYRRDADWPVMVKHSEHGQCLAFLQRFCVNGPEKRIETPDGIVHRYVFTDVEGFVVDESDWCGTQGGARGYMNRVTERVHGKCRRYGRHGFYDALCDWVGESRDVEADNAKLLAMAKASKAANS